MLSYIIIVTEIIMFVIFSSAVVGCTANLQISYMYTVLCVVANSKHVSIARNTGLILIINSNRTTTLQSHDYIIK